MGKAAPPAIPPRPVRNTASWSGTAYSSGQARLISQLTLISGGRSPILHVGTRRVGDGRPTAEVEAVRTRSSFFSQACLPCGTFQLPPGCCAFLFFRSLLSSQRSRMSLVTHGWCFFLCRPITSSAVSRTASLKLVVRSLMSLSRRLRAAKRPPIRLGKSRQLLGHPASPYQT